MPKKKAQGFDYLIVESTIVRAHSMPRAKRGPEDRAIGRSRGGLTTKLHVAVDELGNPVRFIVTPGQAGDVTYGHALIADLPARHVLADKAYDADHFRTAIGQAGEAVIPSSRSRATRVDHDGDI
ncbi:transposase [Novosphingopyxis sp.]|uniref:transposase n=1 Tax=Novosphingopyxis sp. TaxID=2709690 RepID=UPI003B59929B